MASSERRSGRRRAERLLRKRAGEFLRSAPRPVVGEAPASYLKRHERWTEEIDRQARVESLDTHELWRHIQEVAKEQTHTKVTPSSIVSAEAAGLYPPVDFSEVSARAIYEAGRDVGTFQRLSRRYLEIANRLGRQPVVRWTVGGETVLARRRPGRLEVDLWLEGERDDAPEVDDGDLP